MHNMIRSRGRGERLAPGRGRRGIVLPVVLILGLLMLAAAGGLLAVSTQQTRTRARYEVYKDEFAAAEIGVNKAYGQIKYMIENHTPDLKAKLSSVPPPAVKLRRHPDAPADPKNPAPVEFDTYAFPQFKITETFAGNEEVASGKYAGMTLYRLRYQIDVKAHKDGAVSSRFTHGGAAIRQNIEITYVPLYVYAIFYDPVLEVAPSPFMQVSGLVHSNSDAYFQSSNGLNFLKNVTAAGRIYHGRNPAYGTPDGANGDVCFTNSGNGSLVSSKRGDADGWLTGKDADWTAAAQAAWAKGVRDQALGARPLNLPIPASVEPYSLIERAGAGDSYALKQEKFEYKAGLKIVVDSAGKVAGYDQDGDAVALSYKDPKDPSKTKYVYKMTTFYDAREGKTVTSVDLDMGNMIESRIYPANGILYVANEVKGTQPGVVRLTNGAELPHGASSEGFTVATNDPLYIKGDYNTKNKCMGMVVSDALAILSNAWADANSQTYSKRNAGDTTVNCVCISGIVPTADGKYSGGVENFFRFLENWSGRKYAFNGSIICMWASRQAVGKWGNGTTYYSPPNRYWAWDTGLGGLNGPPGAPRVIELNRSTWELQSAAK